MANARVRGPILPTSMVRMMTILPTGVRLGVSPLDKPTVPKAERSSKSILTKGVFSVKVRMKVEMAIHPRARMITHKA